MNNVFLRVMYLEIRCVRMSLTSEVDTAHQSWCALHTITLKYERHTTWVWCGYMWQVLHAKFGVNCTPLIVYSDLETCVCVCLCQCLVVEDLLGTTVESLLTDTPNKGHCIKYLSTMDTTKSPNFNPPINIMQSLKSLYSGQTTSIYIGPKVSFIRRLHCIIRKACSFLIQGA